MGSSRCCVVFLVTLVTYCTSAPDRLYNLDSELNPERIIFPEQVVANLTDAFPSLVLIVPIYLVKPENVNKNVQSALNESEKESGEEVYNNGEKVTYRGAQVWNVPTDQDYKLRIVSRLHGKNEIFSWGGDHSAVDIMVKPSNLEKIADIFDKNNVSYKIVIDDLQKNIDEENPRIYDETSDRKARAYRFWNTYRIKGHIAMPVMKPANRRMAVLGAYLGYNSLDEHMEYWPAANWGHRMTWQQYHRLDDIHGYLEFLATTYPEICSVNTIGKSLEGRDLKVLRISSGGENKKAVWIDGGIHAREWISPAVVTYIINYIIENMHTESDAMRNIEWYFLPVVNPDGYEYTHKTDRLWRKNRKSFGSCTGVDLNRNFNYHWGEKGTSNNPCSEVYAGKSPFSEPETQAINDFFRSSSAKFKLFVTYHSYGQLILYPWGYDRIPPSDAVDLQNVGTRAAVAIKSTGGSVYRVGVSSIILYPAAGGSDDWAKGAQNIKYSYTVELSDMGQYGFILPASKIIRVANETLAGLRVMAESAYRS